MPYPMALADNAEAFLTALDSQKTQRWSLLRLDPSLRDFVQGLEGSRVSLSSPLDHQKIEAALQGQRWGLLAQALKLELGLCETSAWLVIALKDVGHCFLEEPEADAQERLASLTQLWESALQACVLYQYSSRPARSAAQRRLQRLRRDYRSLVEQAVVGIYRCHPDGRLLAANPALAEMLGYGSADELLALRGGFYALAERRGELLLRLEQRDEARDFEAQVQRPDGSRLWISENARAVRDAKGRLRWIEGMVLDVTQRMRAEDELVHAALHDSLTGLPNRALFLDRLDLALKRSSRDPAWHFAALFLDLDRFKVINDSLGHAAGDALLKSLAARLKDGLRPGDTVARMGGDEFAILLDGLELSADALPVAERILRSLEEPVRVGVDEIYPSASVGLALGGPHYAQAESILRDADTAMNRAKSKGRGRLEVFDLAMHEEASLRLQIEHGLRRAVEREEIWVAYQPLVSLNNGDLLGFEALARWKHPQLGAVGPDRFIPVAEETGLIEGLGARVLEIACSQAQAWTGQSPDGGSPVLSVNLSSLQLRSPKLLGLLAEVMARHQLGAGRLKLEVTESLLMDDPAFCAKVLGELSELGAEIWLDDFGTGYSSLGSLTQFPIHGIKLDRSFILGLEKSARAFDLLEGVLSLARQMRLNVVAEGIETQAQAELLKRLGCPLAQGYLYSKPLPTEDADRYLRLSRLGAAPI